jgi:hypothetical protein
MPVGAVRRLTDAGGVVAGGRRVTMAPLDPLAMNL